MRVPVLIATLLIIAAPTCFAQAQPGQSPQQPPASQPPQPGGPAEGLPGAEPGAPVSDALYQQQVSYALGRNIGGDLKQNEIQCDFESLLAGIRDAVTEAKPKWTEQELEGAMRRFEQEMQQKSMARLQAASAKNKQQEAAFLAENKKKEGVQTTPSGLQYKVVKQGNGPSPTLKDKVRCNYRGVLLNGTEFDASERHGGPAEFMVGQVIPGWTEALQKMHVGDKWQLFIPSGLAYDMEPPPGSAIEPGSMLVFEIELLGIDGQ
jgi:FKBP-type peptidyl-prolyl cis-trans isomerase FklB